MLRSCAEAGSGEGGPAVNYIEFANMLKRELLVYDANDYSRQLEREQARVDEEERARGVESSGKKKPAMREEERGVAFDEIDQIGYQGSPPQHTVPALTMSGPPQAREAERQMGGSASHFLPLHSQLTKAFKHCDRDGSTYVEEGEARRLAGIYQVDPVGLEMALGNCEIMHDGRISYIQFVNNLARIDAGRGR